jgi:hypothetical protein
MNISDTPLQIRTLGRFSILAAGKPVVTVWPDETIKLLFCSLLSPLDLYFSWDRLCRSIWGIPETRVNRRQLEEMFIRPLNSFLITELGFNPLITGHEGIRIDQQRIHVDAFEFYNTVLEGLRQLSLGSHAPAFEIFIRAKALYVGSFLPGMPGKIIESTRKDLDSLYRTAVMGSIPVTLEATGAGRTISSEPWQH